ncbi:MAG: FxLYD domain-containing protein [Oscillospiraceae bacterium]|nr:FxLYD domain-containing protein [Oscillospiraceae bacterium]
MKAIGILLTILGAIGLALSAMMFGDIGIAAGIGSITAILSGIGFLLLNRKLLIVAQSHNQDEKLTQRKSEIIEEKPKYSKVATIIAVSAIIFVVLLFIVVIFVFIVPLVKDDKPIATSQNQGQITGNQANNNEVEYEIAYQNATTYVDSIGTVWVSAIFEVKNIGATALYLEPGAYDLEDLDGKLVSSSTLVSVYPTMIEPGESAFYYENTTLADTNSAIDVVILPRVDAKLATINNVRLEVSDIEFTEDDIWGIGVRGRVENATDEEQSSVTIAILLYDFNDNPVGVLSTTLMENISQGDRIGFEASALSSPPDMTFDNIARYVSFAYPWLQWQW